MKLQNQEKSSSIMAYYQINNNTSAYIAGKSNVVNGEAVLLESQDGNITIPETIFDKITEMSYPVVSIGPNIFKFRRDLKVLYLPKTIKEFNTDFYNCPNFERFVVDEDNKSLTAIDGVLFSKDKKHLIYHPSSRNEDYYIPEGTEELDNCSFKCNYNIKNIWCPKSLKKIGINVFYDCPHLENVYDIPEAFRVFMRESRLTNFKVTTAKFHVGKKNYSLAEMTELFPQ